MERVGFIGIGNMGLRMSKNVLNAGYDLTAYDVREEALTELADLKAHIAKSPREVGEASDIVFIMVLNGLQA
jgi:2-hydroxy-3-oxopropionate reductase